MNDQDKIGVVENIIDEHFEANGQFEIEFEGDFEEFKKQMLKLLLPWRDFEKEKPEENSLIIISDEYNSFSQLKYRNEYIPNLLADRCKYIYKEELEATLPEE